MDILPSLQDRLPESNDVSRYVLVQYSVSRMFPGLDLILGTTKDELNEPIFLLPGLPCA